MGRQSLRDEPFALRYWSWDFGYRIVILLLFFGLGRWVRIQGGGVVQPRAGGETFHIGKIVGPRPGRASESRVEKVVARG